MLVRLIVISETEGLHDYQISFNYLRKTDRFHYNTTSLHIFMPFDGFVSSPSNTFFRCLNNRIKVHIHIFLKYIKRLKSQHFVECSSRIYVFEHILYGTFWGDVRAISGYIRVKTNTAGNFSCIGHTLVITLE